MRPLLSLGELQHCSVDDWSQGPSYAIGNSFASPYVSANKTYGLANNVTQVDHSYILNRCLFDSYFFSGLAPRADLTPSLTQSDLISALTNPSDPRRQSGGVLENGVLPDPRIRLGANSFTANATTISATTALTSGSGSEKPYALAAACLVQDGTFNVNSTSADAWKVLLSSARGAVIPTLDPVSGTSLAFSPESKVVFPRCLLTNGDSSKIWRGYRALSESDITNLAAKIVEQVKLRGPFLSLSDFVNRRLATSGGFEKKGALQAAIDEAGLNSSFSSTTVSAQDPTEFPSSSNSKDIFVDGASNDKGYAENAAPGYLLQGDILQVLAPRLTARGDTFLIRSYGDTADKKGNIQSKAWCEAVVQRISDRADSEFPSPSYFPTDPKTDKGRRFRVVSFRWLGQEEL